MQSGIQASAELQSAFSAFLSDSSQRALLIKIESESLVPSYPSRSSSTQDFLADLNSIRSHLLPTEASFIILRTSSPSSPSSTSELSALQDEIAAITYIPDSAAVRQKTLYASTRLTLVRALGTGNFSDNIFITDAQELSPEGWKAYIKHKESDRPLTREEQDAVKLREAEGEETATMGLGSASGRGGKVSHYVTTGGANRKGINVGEGIEEALRRLKDSQGGDMVQLKIDIATETLVLDLVKKGVEVADLEKQISGTDPRYTFYTFVPTTNGQVVTIFIYTCPTDSKIKERMIYAQSRLNVVQLAETDLGLNIAKKLEGSDPKDFSQQALESEFSARQEENKGFARPKRPGRR